MKIEIGKSYRNGLGQIRTIVGTCSEDWEPYKFEDQFTWTYTEDGIYDENDTYHGDTRYDLTEEVENPNAEV